MDLRLLLIPIAALLLPIVGVGAFGYVLLTVLLGAANPADGSELPDSCVVAASAEEFTIPVDGEDGTYEVSLSERQMEVAATIVNTGRMRAVPDDGVQIALMVALQESTLRNLANDTVPASFEYPNDGSGKDRDSVNAFQQRPSSGWGTVDELMNEQYAASAFYGGPGGPNEGDPAGLLDVSGWRGLPKGEAAQIVQVSRYPEAYAKWEQGAKKILAELDSNAGDCDVDFEGEVVLPLEPGYVISAGGGDWGPRDIGGNASKWHAGVDLSYNGGAATTCGRPVFSVMDGTVVRSDWLWLSIEHEDGFVISYLHMYEEDHLVEVGDRVAAGTQIGVIGNAGAEQGMSFGCHLDFRIDTTRNTNPDVADLTTVADLGGDPLYANYVNPREFMLLFGMPLVLIDIIS